MILPVVAFGDPVLRKVAKDVDPDFPNLKELIQNMWETMYNAHGVGIAAPQIGKALRLFVIDATPFAEDEDFTEEERAQLKDFKKVFINPKLVSEEGEEWAFEEGCLSIPGVYLEVTRPDEIEISYKNEMGKPCKLKATGLLSRAIQHEMDHLNGVMFVDRVNNNIALNEELKKRGFAVGAVKPVKK